MSDIAHFDLVILSSKADMQPAELVAAIVDRLNILEGSDQEKNVIASLFRGQNQLPILENVPSDEAEKYVESLKNIHVKAKLLPTLETLQIRAQKHENITTIDLEASNAEALSPQIGHNGRPPINRTQSHKTELPHSSAHNKRKKLGKRNNLIFGGVALGIVAAVGYFFTLGGGMALFQDSGLPEDVMVSGVKGEKNTPLKSGEEVQLAMLDVNAHNDNSFINTKLVDKLVTKPLDKKQLASLSEAHRLLSLEEFLSGYERKRIKEIITKQKALLKMNRPDLAIVLASSQDNPITAATLTLELTKILSPSQLKKYREELRFIVDTRVTSKKSDARITSYLSILRILFYRQIGDLVGAEKLEEFFKLNLSVENHPILVRLESLIQAANAYHHYGFSSKRLLEQAKKLVRSIPSEKPYVQAQGLAKLSAGLAALGQARQMAPILERVKDLKVRNRLLHLVNAP